MKKLALLLALAPGLALAATIPSTGTNETLNPPTAGIVNTPHNFSSNPAATSADGEICKYCHTPHYSQGSHLIFNKTKSTQAINWGTQGTTPITTTSEGTTLPTSLVGHYSASCMGCHDGTVALGDVSNAGGGPAGVVNFSGTGVTGNKLSTASWAEKTFDQGNLAGNHPIGVPYPGTGTYTVNGVSIVAFGNTTFQTGAGEYYTVDANGYVQPSGSNAAVAGVVPISLAMKKGVECSTCHNPHGSEGIEYMLRATLKSSALCLSCHNK